MKKTNTSKVSKTMGHLKPLILLITVFTFTTAITFGGRRALDPNLDAQPTEVDLEQARKDAQAAIPRLPEGTEEQIAAVLYPSSALTETFSDPLVDHAGLAAADTGAPVRTYFRSPAIITTTAALATPVIPQRMARLSQWQQSVREANASRLIPPPITTAYLVSEVAPIGRLDMQGRTGAWFYLESEKRSFATNIGATFYDGVLTAVSEEGVVFRTSSGQTKVIQWDRHDELSTAPAPTTAAADQQSSPQASPHPTPQPARGISGNGPALAPLAPAALPKEEYSDLQVAVRDRYKPTETLPVTERSRTRAARDTKVPSPRVTQSLMSQPTAGSSATQPPEGKRELNFAHASSPATREDIEGLPSEQDGSNLPRESSTANGPDLNQLPSAAKQTTTPTASAVTSTQFRQIDRLLNTTAPPDRQTVADAQPALSPPRPASGPTNAPGERRLHNSLCDPAFRGEDITVTNESNRSLSLLTFVNRINEAYAANIVLDYDVQETPVRLTINNAPWTSVLHTLLDLNDLDMVCLDRGIVQIAKRLKITQMADQRKKTAPLLREVFKLRYLQPTAGGRANLAGQTQATNGATIKSLEDTIRDIIKAGGDTRGDARQVPGQNQLLVAATQDQMEEIRDLISRVDRPGYQVVIKALVYTANENRLRDIGSQLSVIVGNASGTRLGGGTTLPNPTSTGTGSTTGQAVSGINPGGIPGLPRGIQQPTNGLSAASPIATLGVSSIFGTAQFAYQLTLAQQRGIVNIQSRPFGIVGDGNTFDLVAGTQIPIVTTTIAGGAPFQSGQVQFIEASRIARITPQVAEDEQGHPSFVTLNVQLENNSVDTSLGTFNGVPGVNRQSLQTVLRLRNGETVVIGGLAADQVSNSSSKVPGLGNIPGLGHLFKRKMNQEVRDRLYFAITVEVVPQDTPMINLPAPSDAQTVPPPPPGAQRPSPYDAKRP